MRHDRATEEIQERAALYALGALTQLEARSFEIHMQEGCPACQTLARQFGRITECMGYAAPEIEAPSYLRDLLAARVEREPRTPPPLMEPLPPGPAAEVSHKPSARPIIKAPAPHSSLFPWVLAFCFAVAAVFLYTSSKNAEKRAEVSMAAERGIAAAARAEADRLKALLQTSQGNSKSGSRELDQVSAALSSKSLRIMTLLPQQPDTAAALAIFWDKEKNRWIVIGQMPPPPPGRDYQLWFMTPQAKISAGLLEPGAEGYYFKALEVPPTVTQIQSAVVTIEPKNGSEQPTTRAFLIGKIG